LVDKERHATRTTVGVTAASNLTQRKQLSVENFTLDDHFERQCVK